MATALEPLPPDCQDCKHWYPVLGEDGICRAHAPQSTVLMTGIDSSDQPIFQVVTHYPETRATGNGCHEHVPLKQEGSPRG